MLHACVDLGSDLGDELDLGSDLGDTSEDEFHTTNVPEAHKAAVQSTISRLQTLNDQTISGLRSVMEGKKPAKSEAARRGNASSSSEVAAPNKRRKSGGIRKANDLYALDRLSSDNIVSALNTSLDDHHKYRCTCKKTMAAHRPNTICPQACNLGLWSVPGEAETQHLIKHLKHYTNMPERQRGRLIFKQLALSYKHTWSPINGTRLNDVREGWFDYHVNGRAVCQPVWLSAFPISRDTLVRWENMIRQNTNELGECTLQSPYKAENEGVRKSSEKAINERKHLDFVAWVLVCASSVGDYLPDDNVLVTPRREKKSLHEEYEADQQMAGRPSYSYGHFVRCLKSTKELQHIKVSRLKGNFEKCNTCKNFDELIRAAIKARQPDKVQQYKAERAAHCEATKGERLYYYSKRHKARNGLCTSLILDKWDQKKCSQPWFVSPIKGAAMQEILKQKVQGVIVHGSPSRYYLIVANETIPGDR